MGVQSFVIITAALVPHLHHLERHRMGSIDFCLMRSHLTSGDDVVVMMCPSDGIVAAQALPGLDLDLDGIESYLDELLLRTLGLVYLCETIPNFKGLLEDIQEASPPKQLTIDTTTDVVHLVADHLNVRWYKDFDQHICVLPYLVSCDVCVCIYADRFRCQDTATRNDPNSLYWLQRGGQERINSWPRDDGHSVWWRG